MSTAFFTDERCFWHTTGESALILPVGGWVQPPAGSGHAESPETKRRLKNLVEVSGLARHLVVTSAQQVRPEDMLRVHAPAYLDQFRAVSDACGGQVGENAPFGRGSFEIAALSAGLVAAAVEAVWTGAHTNAYALSRPPGHHCLPDRGMGFCFLANIPIALERLRARHGAIRAAVLDWDVHHGNGTEAIYRARGDTLTISIHQESCYPPGSGQADDRGTGAGLGANLNVPLLPGGGHQAYLDAMELLVEPAIRAFRPEIIVVASGLDANGVDPLARMLAHSGTFRALTARVKALAAELCGGRLVLAHEGGYAEVAVPFCGLAILEELAGQRTAVEDPLLALIAAQQPLPDVVAFQRARLEAQAKAAFG